jgi:hypothetical protein
MGIPILDTIFADLDKVLQALFGMKATATPSVTAPKTQSPSVSDDPLSAWFLPEPAPSTTPNKNPLTITSSPEKIGAGSHRVDLGLTKNFGYQAGGQGAKDVLSAMNELEAFSERNQM